MILTYFSETNMKNDQPAKTDGERAIEPALHPFPPNGLPQA